MLSVYMYIYEHKFHEGYTTYFPNIISPKERHDNGNKK